MDILLLGGVCSVVVAMLSMLAISASKHKS